MGDEQPPSGTIAALNENIRRLNDTILALRDEMVTTYVRKDVYEAEKKEWREDISSLKNWLVWGQRIVIGAVFLALLALVIKQQVTAP